MTATPPARDLVVVDIETSGLDPHRHTVLEVCAINLRTNDELHFVPEPKLDWKISASNEAMAINRYFERHVYRDQLDTETSAKRWEELADMLDGAIVCGAAPWFDVSFLDPLLWPDTKPRRDHHLRDLGTYAAGVLAVDPAVSWSQSRVLELLNITNTGPHSARGDARACAEAFLALFDYPGDA